MRGQLIRTLNVLSHPLNRRRDDGSLKERALDDLHIIYREMEPEFPKEAVPQ